MRSFGKCLFFMTVLLAGSSVFSQQFNVVKVDKSKAPSLSEGIYYSLPRTQFNFEVTISKVEKIKGPYAEFAGKYLGLTNVIFENSTSYELGDISISTTSVPDPEQYYFVEINSKQGKEANDLIVSLSESGIIQNTNGGEQDGKETVSIKVPFEETNVYPDIFKYFSDLNMFEQVDTIIERVKHDTTTIEKLILRRTFVEKTPEQRAKEAADFIIKVKENRFNLISGFQEVNYEKETFQLMNQELEKLETEYQKLFTGISFTKTEKYYFSYLPDPLYPIDTLPLFKFSRQRGILDTSSRVGEMVYLKINRTHDTYLLNDYMKRKAPPKDGLHGFVYRIPEYVEISVLQGDKPRGNGRFLVSQFGVICWLPALKAGIQFYPATGTIMKASFKN
jgi:hypothetical protein